MLDFKQYEVNPLKMYGGANGSKIGIIIDGDNYMVKFPSKAKHNPDLSYANSSVTEHIGCQVGSLLNYDMQETLLGSYENQVVVACKDFEESGYRLKEFALLKNSIIDSEQGGFGTDLDDILFAIEEQQLVDPYDLENHFWDMFALDALIGNFDRHNGNWGFLVNEESGNVKLAPIYDCGSCLFPQNSEENMKSILNDKQEMNIRSNSRPTSAIRLNGVRINYYEFIKNTDSYQCVEAIQRLQSNFDAERITECINDMPIISDLQKEFYTNILQLRKARIIDRGLYQNRIFQQELNRQHINRNNDIEL